MHSTINFIRDNSIEIIVWDFDGVIKETLEVKSQAFSSLFAGYGSDIRRKVAEHHLSNGGMPRYEKFLIYLDWVNETASEERLNALSLQFEKYVFGSIINAKWVPGVIQLLETTQNEISHYLFTATPEHEIKKILDKLRIDKIFKGVFGFPTKKEVALAGILNQVSVPSSRVLVIGDSRADFRAAMLCNTKFLLRVHDWNHNLTAELDVPQSKDFLNHDQV